MALSATIAVAQEQRETIAQIGSPSISTITLRGVPYTQDINVLPLPPRSLPIYTSIPEAPC
jgi:hypothetical protein